MDTEIHDQPPLQPQHRRRNVLRAAEAVGLGLGLYAGYRLGRRGGIYHLGRRAKAIGRGLWKRWIPGGRKRATARLEEVVAERGNVAASAKRSVLKGEGLLGRYRRYRSRIHRLAAGRRAFSPMH